MSTMISPVVAPVFENAVKKRSLLSSPLTITLSSLLTAAVALILAFHGYVAWVLTHPDIAALSSNPQKAVGLPYQDIGFPSRDGSSYLSGWYIPAAGSVRTIVFSHGYGENREQSWVHVYDLVKALNKSRYNVLMFDYGFVQPKLGVTGGVREKQELLGAVDYARQQGAEKIIVWGFSMGAGTALQAALLDPEIDGMILDSTFLLSPDTLFQNLKQKIDLPRFPSLTLVEWFFPLLGGSSLRDIPVQKLSTESLTVPTLFIHSERDMKAPYPLIEGLAGAQKEKISSLWTVSDALHEMIFREHQHEYLQRTLGFLQGLIHQG